MEGGRKMVTVPDPPDPKYKCEAIKTVTGWEVIFLNLGFLPRAIIKNPKVKNDEVKATLVFTVKVEFNEKTIYNANFNFLSQRASSELVRELAKVLPEYEEVVDYKQFVEYFRSVVLYLVSQGEPVEEFDENITTVEYLIEPFVLQGLPNMIYAKGGSGKTIIACALALSLISNQVSAFNSVASGKVLYLDYENAKSIVFRRIKELADTYGVSYDLIKENFRYRSCKIPFKNDIENIIRIFEDYPADLTIIDSLGVACGGNLKEDTTANEFYSALRHLPTTPLLITHEPKGEENSSAFGSVYFTNYARNIWRFQTKNFPDKIRIVATHEKSNVDQRKQPFALNIIFTDGKVEVEKDRLDKEVDKEEMTLPKLIIEWLKTKGAMTVYELAECLDKSPNTVKTLLNRLEKEGVTLRLNDKSGKRTLWALKYEEPF